MNNQIKYIAKIPTEFQSDAVQWLTIEPHLNNGNIVGYFLFGHKALTEPSEWDIWFQNLGGAFEAGLDYGIERKDWIEKESDQI